MSAWAQGAWRTGAWRGTAWATDDTEPQVVVADVVGLTQSAASTTLIDQGLLFAATTAYSDSVAAGLVISQSPVAGALADSGDLVTVVVSLGAEPVLSVATPRSRTYVVH